MNLSSSASPGKFFLVSYPRSGSTLLRKYFSLLQGRPQRSVYADDIVYEPGEALTHALDGMDMAKSHQWPSGHEDIVYLVRDGRNATLSFLYLKFLIGNHKFSSLHEVQDALRYIDADEGSWADHVKAALMSGDGRRIVFVKYEDLMLRPVWFLQRVLKFMQVSLPSTVLEQCVRLERRSGIYANNPKNGYLFQPQPGSIYDLIKRHRIEDYWRFVFDAPARRYFHECGATEFLLRFGYEQSADWWAQPTAPIVSLQ